MAFFIKEITIIGKMMYDWYEEMRNIKQAGYEAKLAGLNETDNPYSIGDEIYSYVMWLEGYLSGARFVKFTEFNDYENETWDFWLQLDGNGYELRKLSAWLKKEDYDFYSLEYDDLSETQVDLLINHASKNGYLPSINKVKGKFTMPEDVSWNLFYKGGIIEMFKEEQ